MRRRTFTPLLTLVLPLALLTGCARESEEVAQQRQTMTQDVQTWQTALDAWEQENTRMASWHQTHPMPAEADTAKLGEHTSKMTVHESGIADFRRELETHAQRVQAAASGGGDVEHETLWTEHERLKARYEELEGQHKELSDEHAEFAGSDTAGASNM